MIAPHLSLADVTRASRDLSGKVDFERNGDLTTARRIEKHGLLGVLAHPGRRQSGPYVWGLETCKSSGEIAMASTHCKHLLREYRVLCPIH